MRSLTTPTVLATVDGQSVCLPAASTVLQACEAASAGVVALCHHPATGTTDNCDSCQVIVNGMLVRACREPLRPDAVINTRGKAAVLARRQALAAVASDHPAACSVCHQSGACELQNAVGRNAPVPLQGHPVQALPAGTHSLALGNEVELHKELCIGCERCTSFAANVLHQPLLSLDVQPNQRPALVVHEDRPLNSPYALAFAELCPTGVFEGKGLTQTPQWSTSATASVCPRCATGCPIWLHHDNGQLRRVSSRGGAHFLCDYGYRLPQKQVWRRLSVPMAGGAVVSWDRALDASKALLAPAIADGTLGVVLSAQSSTFDLCAVSLFALQRALAAKTYVFAQPSAAPSPPLLDADRNANTRAVAVLAAKAVALDQLVVDAKLGKVNALLVIGPVLIDPELHPELWQAVRALPVLIVATVYDDPLANIATVALPLATFTETAGSFVNAAGRAQAFAAMTVPQGDALPGWDIVNHLARGQGVELGFENLADVRAWLLRHHASLVPEATV